MDYDSLAKVSILGHKGNVTSTPEGTGVREDRSSLEDGSSPVYESRLRPRTLPPLHLPTSRSVYQGPSQDASRTHCRH